MFQLILQGPSCLAEREGALERKQKLPLLADCSANVGRTQASFTCGNWARHPGLAPLHGGPGGYCEVCRWHLTGEEGRFVQAWLPQGRPSCLLVHIPVLSAETVRCQGPVWVLSSNVPALMSAGHWLCTAHTQCNKCAGHKPHTKMASFWRAGYLLGHRHQLGPVGGAGLIGQWEEEEAWGRSRGQGGPIGR